MIKTHYLPQIKPDAHHPQITGYRVWAYIGHPLLGEILGTASIVKTKREAQQIARNMRLNLKEPGYE